jgi:hypothetical protein
MPEFIIGLKVDSKHICWFPSDCYIYSQLDYDALWLVELPEYVIRIVVDYLQLKLNEFYVEGVYEGSNSGKLKVFIEKGIVGDLHKCVYDKMHGLLVKNEMYKDGHWRRKELENKN